MKRNPPKSKSLPLRLSAAVSLLSLQAAALSATPTINADSSATFTLRAPEAHSVKLRCEGVRGADMTKSAGGVWTFTTAPLAPDIYDYSFIVDGVRITDPDNPHLKYNLRNNSSELIIPSPAGTPPQIWEAADVPRGTLHRHTFRSKISGDDRDFIVYTPPRFSSGGLPGDLDRAYPSFNAESSKGIRLVWLACGAEDGLLVANNKIAKWISDHKAPEVCDIYKITDFGHPFRNWRRYFAEFAPLLFQNQHNQK